MKEILFAKTKSCPEFRQSLLESIDMNLVEAVKSDIFWSCGLNPGDAASIRPPYYPGQNQLGRLLEHTRSNLIIKEKKGPNPVSETINIPPQASEQSDQFSPSTTPTIICHIASSTTPSRDGISSTPSISVIKSSISSPHPPSNVIESVHECSASNIMLVNTSAPSDEKESIDHEKVTSNDSTQTKTPGSPHTKKGPLPNHNQWSRRKNNRDQ